MAKRHRWSHGLELGGFNPNIVCGHLICEYVNSILKSFISEKPKVVVNTKQF